MGRAHAYLPSASTCACGVRMPAYVVLPNRFLVRGTLQ